MVVEKMSNETELKLLLAEEDHSRILAAPCLAGYAKSEQHLTNIYFDTPDHALNEARVAVRIREKNGRYIQTLKTQGESINGLSRRGEWEWPLAEPMLNVDKLQKVWSESLHGIDVAALRPVFRTDFTRQIIDVIWEGAEIELALDLGQVISEDKVAPISELELELKKGDESALLSLADELRKLADLTPGDFSKAERGYQLMDCE